MPIKVHREFRVTGSHPKLREFRDTVSRQLPPPWHGAVTQRNALGFEYAIFSRDATPPIPEASLFLSEHDDGLELVNIVPATSTALTVDEYNRIADEFIAVGRRAASDVGLEFAEEGPYSDITRWLPEPVAASLRSFSAGANKSTGSGHPMDFTRWADFIIAARDAGSGLPVNALQRFLVDEEGWDEDQAYKLVREYEFARQILDREAETHHH
jgi:hypothetical protein